jgi:putative transcriptional regulator
MLILKQQNSGNPVASVSTLLYKQHMAATSANRLLEVRKRRGVSLAVVALEMNCDRAHLSRIERGQGQASPDLANRLSKYFEGEVTRDQILFPEDYPDIKKPVRSASAQEAG